MRRSSPALALSLLALALPSSILAQLPASVDIDLADNPTTDSLEIRVRANGATFNELVTGLTFTISWPASSPATLGGRRVPCDLAIPITPTPTVVNGGLQYRTYNAFGTSLMADECPGSTFQSDQWVLLMRVKVNGLTTCTAFNIVNDAFTAANNRNFFVSLNGVDRTGNIEATPDSLGACTVDCLGVPGGAALPGSSCDDNDACTVNDAWSSTCACTGTFTDTDQDGTCDANDGCPTDPNKTAPGICGCEVADLDTDSDGTPDCNDDCPIDPLKTDPGDCGCGFLDTDSDGDLVADCNDGCPEDPLKLTPGICGCGTSDADSDGDAVPDCIDGCPADPLKTEPGVCGCGVVDADGDGDGTADCVDGCPNDPAKTAPGLCGCGTQDIDTDSDGTPDCNDGCVNDPDKTAPGICGCGNADTDSDGDGTPDCNDGCANDPNKVAPGTCGCGSPDPGSACDDGDVQTTNDQVQPGCQCVGSVVDCDDSDDCTADSYDGVQCVNEPLPDSDNDGTCDLVDGCPQDPNKIAPGTCGCELPDTDGDADGTADCVDGCPADPNKVAPGICGCGNADTDGDGDGTADCVDGCPADPNKTAPGQCGCGIADVDQDGDALADCVDQCPSVFGEIGASCDDGDALTGNDAVNDQCICLGTPLNDACGDAEPLTLNLPQDCPANAVVGTNASATPDAGNTLCDLNGFLNDVWYSFNSGDNSEVTMNFDHGSMPHWGLALYGSCGGDPLQCFSMPQQGPVVSVLPNTDYLVRVYSALWSGGGGLFSICLQAGIGSQVQETIGQQVELYPNPNEGSFQVRIGAASEEVEVRVTDMTGRLVLNEVMRTQGSGLLSVETMLPPGTYLLHLRSRDEETVRRFVVR